MKRWSRRIDHRRVWLRDPVKGTCRFCGKICEKGITWHKACGKKYWSLTWGLRASIFKRDKGICVDCGLYDPKWEADHVIPLADGGPHTLDNIATRCKKCHKKKTSAENSRRARVRRRIRWARRRSR